MLAVTLSALGCATSATLRAKPDVVCAGRAVRLSWDGSSGGELEAEPEDPSLGDVPASGTKTVHPRTTTTYRFRAGSFLASATGEASVKVVAPPARPVAIGAPTGDENAGCSPHAVWVTARVAPDAWDPRLRVNLVASSDGRPYRIEHAGRTGSVGPGEPSDAFRDLPVAGAWRLETPLRAGEVCGESTPQSLSVDVSFVCAD